MGNVVFECAQPMGSMKLEDAGYGKLLVIDAGDGKAPSTLQIPNDKLEAFADAVRGGAGVPSRSRDEDAAVECFPTLLSYGSEVGQRAALVGRAVVHRHDNLHGVFIAQSVRGSSVLGDTPQQALDELARNCTPAPARASTQSDGELGAIQDPVGDEPRKSTEARCERCRAGFGYREEVSDFAITMENKLLENDHKAHWLEAGDVPFFLKRLWGELEELEDAILDGMSPDMVEAEAADVACFAMFVAQRTRQDFEGGAK